MNGKTIAYLLNELEAGSTLETRQLKQLGLALVEVVHFLNDTGLERMAGTYRTRVVEISSYLYNRGSKLDLLAKL